MIRPQLEEFMRRMDQKSVPSFPARAKPRVPTTRSIAFARIRFLLPDRLRRAGLDRRDRTRHENRSTRCSCGRAIRNRRSGWDGAPELKARRANLARTNHFRLRSLTRSFTTFSTAPKISITASASIAISTTQIIRKIAEMRALNRKPIHPPQTIIDPATIVHEMRVLKSPEEIELMQTAADIAAEAHVEAMKAVRAGHEGIRSRSADRTDISPRAARPVRRTLRSSARAQTPPCFTTSTTTASCAMASCCWSMPALNTKATLPTSRARFRSTAVTPKAQREIYDLVLEDADVVRGDGAARRHAR